MSRLRVNSFSVSLDGYGAGPNQSLQEPLGVGGETLHRWVVGTRTFRQLFGNEGGSTGVSTIQQYLRAGLIDELHLAFAPVLLGSGEGLFADIDVAKLGYQVTEHVATPAATHVVLTKGATA